MGMPTQTMSRAEITKRYGDVKGPVASVDDQPLAPRQPAGRITDDTEQAVLVARLLIESGGSIAPQALADALVIWQDSMIERGSKDLLGPSTTAALTALRSGVPWTESGRGGTTNGAAMRIAPVGIVRRPGAELWERVRETTWLTHGTNLGLAGAYAVAAAVSGGIEGADPYEAVIEGIAAAHFGAERGVWVAGADIAARFDALAPLARRMTDDAFATFAYQVVGTSVQSQESLVTAFLLVDRYADEPFKALTTAASLGGDTDTIGAIAGAVLGACWGPSAFPEADIQLVESVNQLDLRGLSSDLFDLRS
jgi:ADP-ribosylglycohydrolase